MPKPSPAPSPAAWPWECKRYPGDNPALPKAHLLDIMFSGHFMKDWGCPADYRVRTLRINTFARQEPAHV